MSITDDILDAEEHEYGVFRQHYIFLTGQVVTEFVLIGLVAVAYSMLGLVPNVNSTIATIINWLLGGTALVLVGSVVLDATRWYYNAIIVTDRRLIRREGLLQRDIVDMSLARISEIRMDQSLWGRIFGYADFVVMSESETGQEIRGIGEPILFRTTLDDARVGEFRPNIHSERDEDPPMPLRSLASNQPQHSSPSTTQIMAASADDAHRLHMWSMLESLYEQEILTADELEAKRRLLFEPQRRTAAPTAQPVANVADDDHDDVDMGMDEDDNGAHVDERGTMGSRIGGTAPSAQDDDLDTRTPPPYQPPYPSSPYQSRDPSEQREE